MNQEDERRQELGIIPRFPQVIDSSMLSAFRACNYKAYLNYFEHWHSKYESVHLVAGGAFAKGVEVARKKFYEEGMNEVDSEAYGLQALIANYGQFECPPESPKSLERMSGALEYYFSIHPLGRDGMEPITLESGRRGIEFSFAEPLDLHHPVTLDPLLYSGRSDMIAHFAGAVFNVDEKTTTQLGAKWGGQWNLRSQFTSYGWAGRRVGIKMAGTIVRGISILKNKYDNAQAIVYHSDWELDRWEQLMYRQVRKMLDCWAEGLYDQDLDGSCVRAGNPFDRSTDSACNDYGGCQFREVCKAKDPYSVLEIDFARRVWDPLSHREIPIEEWEAEHYGQ